ncbi:cohesin domain-containing protein, partial [Acidobacteriota bacterium]
TLVMRFEVTSVGADPDGPSGPIPPTFGNRTVNTEIRLKDGETNLLAGLYTERGAESRAGLPGVVDLPILRDIFASNEKQYQETDIVLTLTPHIVRTPNITKMDLEPFWVGSEQNVRFSQVGLESPSGRSPFTPSDEAAPHEQDRQTRAEERRERLRRLREERQQREEPSEEPSEEEPPGGRSSLSAPGEQTEGAESVIASSTAPLAGTGDGADKTGEGTGGAEGSGEGEGTSASTAPGTGEPSAPEPIGVSQPAVVSLAPSSIQAGVGDTIDVSIVINQGQDVSHVPFHIAFDPQLIRVLGVVEGDYLNSNGSRTMFMHNIKPNGQVWVGLSRVGGKSKGIDGSGTLARMRIEALKSGTSELKFQEAFVKDASSQNLKSHFLNGQVVVR